MIKRYAIVLICLITIASTGGVFATWQYTALGPTPADKSVGVSLSIFDYPPEEVLPGGGGGGGGNTDPVNPGENHFKIIDIIVNTANKDYSLNNSNSLFHSLLKKQPVVYSNQKTSGGNLKFVLDPTNNTHGLYYCIEKANDTLYYIYTFSVDDLSTAGGSATEIQAYRTSVEKTDKWRATVSYSGYALTTELSDIGIAAASQALKYSIVVSSWHL